MVVSGRADFVVDGGRSRLEMISFSLQSANDGLDCGNLRHASLALITLATIAR